MSIVGLLKWRITLTTEQQISTLVYTIGICDDHAGPREFLAAHCDEQPDLEVIGHVATGAEAVALATSQRPDVMIVDLRLPDIPGTEVIQQIKERAPGVKCCVWTGFEMPAEVYAADDAGAEGFISKTQDGESFLEALRQVAKGNHMRSQKAHLLAEIRRGRGPDYWPEDEISILNFFRKGLTNEEIGGRLHYSKSLVKQKVQTIHGKLGTHTRETAIIKALQQGLITRDD